MSELQPDGTSRGPPRIEYYHLDLVLAKGYLGDPRIVRYLVQIPDNARYLQPVQQIRQSLVDVVGVERGDVNVATVSPQSGLTMP